MSRTGIGYEISFAYNNFDNKIMYPLILLILAVSILINAILSHWEQHPHAKARPVMTAKSWLAPVNSLILIAVLFVAWQLLFEFAGSQAMTRAGRDLPLPRPSADDRELLGPRRGNLARLFLRTAARGAARPYHRFPLRRASVFERSVRAGPGCVLLHSEDHALSDHPAGVRARAARQDRVRHHSWRRAGCDLHHGRGAQSQSDPAQDRARAATSARESWSDRCCCRRRCRKSSPAFA